MVAVKPELRFTLFWESRRGWTGKDLEALTDAAAFVFDALGDHNMRIVLWDWHKMTAVSGWSQWAQEPDDMVLIPFPRQET